MALNLPMGGAVLTRMVNEPVLWSRFIDCQSVRVPRRPEPNHEALRHELSRLRAEKRLTYDKLAELTGLSRTVLINLEHGTTRGSLDTWHRVAHGLGVPLGSLMDQLCHGHRPPS
jgi:DNA-binding XRE family transcriptional regulator